MPILSYPSLQNDENISTLIVKIMINRVFQIDIFHSGYSLSCFPFFGWDWELVYIENGSLACILWYFVFIAKTAIYTRGCILIDYIFAGPSGQNV